VIKKTTMENLYNQKIINANQVFDDTFLDAKMLYLYCYNALPSQNYIGQVNGEKAFTAFRKEFAADIKQVHEYKWYKSKKRKYAFERTVVIMQHNCIVEFDEYYCEFFHDNTHPDFVEKLTKLVGRFKERKKKEPLEINLIVNDHGTLRLRAVEIKKTKLDLSLFYEDDLRAVDETIRKRLSQDNDKGIVLLHGLPGTGKTTYLRYLVGRLKKRVMFLSPSVAGNLVNPDFIELLVNNPNTVLIIEDAENIIMDRRYSNSASVSNLLNISDGLLADFLNVQLICTFNNSLTMVDHALLRKGRLIAKYEFGKLSTEKAKRLSLHLGHATAITEPMTIAEIANPHEKKEEVKSNEVIGFRVKETMMN
jgi:ATPase family associated with various cellular activities (AAA)